MYFLANDGKFLSRGTSHTDAKTGRGCLSKAAKSLRPPFCLVLELSCQATFQMSGKEQKPRSLMKKRVDRLEGDLRRAYKVVSDRDWQSGF